MMKFFSPVVFIALIFFLIPQCTNAQKRDSGSSGAISVKVRDAKTHDTLLNATVQILETKQGRYTGDQGIATINNMKSGRYTVVIRCWTYEPKTIENIEVRVGDTTRYEVQLKELPLQKREKYFEVTRNLQGVHPKAQEDPSATPSKNSSLSVFRVSDLSDSTTDKYQNGAICAGFTIGMLPRPLSKDSDVIRLNACSMNISSANGHAHSSFIHRGSTSPITRQDTLITPNSGLIRNHIHIGACRINGILPPIQDTLKK